MFFRNWYYLYIKDIPAQTAFEKELCKLGEPYRVQHPFPWARCVADFYLPNRRLVIEIDGASHSEILQKIKDHRNTLALEAKGIAVVRVTNAEVFGGGALGLALGRITGRLSQEAIQAELNLCLSLLPPGTKLGKRRSKRRKGVGQVPCSS